MIYISRVLGGPELRGSRIERAIVKVTTLRGEGQEGASGSLDIVFHVAGSVLCPEHTGIRTGRFSKKERMLMLQIAVPPEVVGRDDDYAIEAFLVGELREAVRMATPVFARAKIPYDEKEHLSVIDGIAAALLN